MAMTERMAAKAPFAPAPDDHLIICRCEEITKGDIRRAVHNGMRTLAEVKRYLRVGMGLCQGQTCGRLVAAVVARELGSKVSALELTARAPMRPIETEVFGNEIK